MAPICSREYLTSGGPTPSRTDGAANATKEVAGSDAEAVAAVAMLALVGHHLASRFFGAPIGADAERFVQTLARMVRGDCD